jgi:hypothetical protein
MRHFVLLLVGLLVFTEARADWVKLYDRGNYGIYVDVNTIRREGNLAKMWYLSDLHKADTTANGKQYKSTKMQDEYDCKEELHRTLYLSAHSENMGTGDTISVVSNPQIDKNWSPVPPKSVAKDMWNIACGKH